MDEADAERERPNWVLRICLGLSLLPVALVLRFCAYIDHQDRLAPWVPAKLELSDSYRSEGEDGVMSHCGISVYGLGGGTVEEIRREGIAYFKDAGSPRDGKIPRAYTWHETPLTDDSGVLALNCAPGLAADLGKRLRRAMESRGSYWARDGDHALYVVPSLGIVVSSHQD